MDAYTCQIWYNSPVSFKKTLSNKKMPNATKYSNKPLQKYPQFFRFSAAFKYPPPSLTSKPFKPSVLVLIFSAFVFSIGTQAIDTFDKSAYLNLNQEYNWNNPKSYIKKDNQATTLLKEVAGTVRNALGSTDSDNAGDLGNKITIGLQNQLKNKAINATEGLINDKANQFVNRFGSGRSEINIHGLSSKALDYSLKTIQPLSELNDNSKDLTFFQGQLNSDDNQGNRSETINLGIGHRILVDNDTAIAGINLFHDYQTKSAHKRLSLGLEYQRTNFQGSSKLLSVNCHLSYQIHSYQFI